MVEDVLRAGNMARKSSSSRPMRRKRYWVIEGYNSLRRMFREEVRIGHFNDSSIRLCLQALCAAEGELTRDEIIGACAKRGSSGANTLLEVHRDAQTNTYRCGENPHFTARRMDS